MKFVQIFAFQTDSFIQEHLESKVTFNICFNLFILSIYLKSTLCGCGNFLKYRNDIETKCNMPCDGNINENCGGYYYFSVYFTGN